jgi:2,3-bisphosphoglycerate-independent phosphoglycerate mutase
MENDSSKLVETNKLENKEEPKLLLCLFLDGFGISTSNEANAVAAAKMPNLFKYICDYPVTLLSGKTKDIRRRYWSFGCGVEDDSDNFLKAETCLSAILGQAGIKQVKIVASEQLSGLNLFFNNGKNSLCTGEVLDCLSSPSPDEALRPFGKNILKSIENHLDEKKVSEVIFASLPLIQEASLRGDFKEIVNNLEQVDKLLAKIVTTVLNKNGLIIITSPYGNAERTKDLATDWIDKGPTNNPVPFLLIGSEYKGRTIGLADPLDGDLSVLAPAGTLADFAPTVLTLLNLDKPVGMTGKSLI